MRNDEGFSSALIFMGGKDIQDPIDFITNTKETSHFFFVRITTYLNLILCSPSMTHTKQMVGLFYLEDWRMGYGDMVK
jgi:hypothetical protein